MEKRKKRRVASEETEADYTEYVYTNSEKLDDLGIYYLVGEVCTETLAPIQESLLVKHFDQKWNNNNEMTILINSEGGSLSDAFALINIMDFVKMNIRTVAMGSACSSAFMILMAGTEGMRGATQDCLLMSHKYTDFVGGKNYSELVADRKGQDIVDTMMVNHYIKRSKYSQRKTVEKYLLQNTDSYMNANEALKHGAIDYVVGE